MMQIIVPTDFSKPAAQALAFAAELATHTNSSILLLHMLPNVGPTLGRVPTEHWKVEMEEQAAASLQELKQPLEQRGIAVAVSIIHDTTVAEALDDLPSGDVTQLVVMGTKGASGLKKILLGSNTVDVINQCCIPVIVVPENAMAGPIDTLLCATDLEHTLQEMKLLLPYAEEFKASIHLIHVQQSNRLAPEAISIQALQQEAGTIPVSFEMIAGSDLAETLERFKAEKPAALLVMFTHTIGFFDQIFQRSLVREIAWHGTIPLLVIKNS
jgi:nucleotide-binding universal stress UspA family protein